jgi:hypothetical protein
MARTTEERAPDSGEACGQGGRELGQRTDRTLLDEHRLDLRDRARAGLVAPRDVEILAPDDVGEIRGQDEVGVRVIVGQMEVRHLSKLPGAARAGNPE